jgi:hydroxyethylthiazole kinase-like uncharacterized protein yjeF
MMQRAATGLATTCADLLPAVYGANVVLLVGTGDNGGDALFAGARLARRGARVSAVLLGASAHQAGLRALQAAGGRVATPDVIESAELVLDGITGIGGRGGLRPEAAAAVARIPGNAFVVAVDVPSGVDADSGEVSGDAVRADVTVTFGTNKPGLLIDPGAEHAGVVELVDIGLGPHLPDARVEVLQAHDVVARLPRPHAESDKYRRGVVGVAAGSLQYTGAAVLAVGGAIRAGAGMVRFVSVSHPAELVRAHWPEVVVTVIDPERPRDTRDSGQVQAAVVGPGIGTDAIGQMLLREVLHNDVPVVIDADGLTLIARDPGILSDRRAPTVLTPHAGELARLLGEERADVEARRLHHVHLAAQRFGATVLLKGSTTVIADPDGATRVNPTGTPWLATAGSGDVLAGAIGAMLATGVTTGLGTLDAVSIAAYLHGAAARFAADGASISAQDVLTAWPSAVRALSR